MPIEFKNINIIAEGQIHFNINIRTDTQRALLLLLPENSRLMVCLSTIQPVNTEQIIAPTGRHILEET